MKTSNRNKLISLALAGGFSLLGATNASAAAGDTISNFATLSYDVGGTPQTVIESGVGPAGNSIPGVGQAAALLITTDFIEDRIINFTVTREGGTVSVSPNSTGQAIPFLVDNTGNGTHGFLLTAVHNLGVNDPHGGTPDVFTPTTAPFKTYVDSDNNGVLDLGEIADANSFIPTFAPGAGPAPGGTIRVFAVADIPVASRVPNPLVTNDVAVISLVAHASVDGTTGIVADAIISDDNIHNSPGGTFNGLAGPIVILAGTAVAATPDSNATMQTVFNDAVANDANVGADNVDATGALDSDQNAQQSSYSSFTVTTASLSVSKTASVLYDPLNFEVSPKAIPGAFVRYTVTITNTGATTPATLTSISDTLVGTTMDPVLSNGGNLNPVFPGSGANNMRVFDGTNQYFCTADDSGAGDLTDGCSLTAGTIVVNFTTIAALAGAGLPIDDVLNPAGVLTVEFNVITP